MANENETNTDAEGFKLIRSARMSLVRGVEDVLLLGAAHPSFSSSTNKTLFWAQWRIEYAGG